MKHKLIVFLSFILIVSILAVPAFAADSSVYEFHFVGTSSDAHLFSLENVVPEGFYVISFYSPSFGMVFDSLEPVEISYAYNADNDFLLNYQSFSSALFLYEGENIEFEFGLFTDKSSYSFAGIGLNVQEGFFEDVILTLTPVSPSLSAVVNSDMMSGVLDEIVALLPAVLAVIVGFIAIRKGVSFIRGIVSGA